MSLLYPQTRWRRRLMWLLYFAVIYGSVKLVSAWTGFGAWIETTPTALAAYRVFAILLFTCFGAIAIFTARTDRRPWLHYLISAVFAVFAFLHIALFLTGASGPSDLFPE